jgi:hypothetical protein
VSQRIRFRYAKGTQGVAEVSPNSTALLQPLSGLSDNVDQTAAGSPRQPHPQSSPVSQPPCRFLRVRYCCASPAQPPAAPSSTTRRSLWLLAENHSQTSNQISRIRGTDGAMKLPNPGHCPLTKMPGSGLPALSSAPHHHATPCVWPLNLACFGLAKEIPIEGTQDFMRKHLCVCLVTPPPMFSFL